MKVIFKIFELDVFVYGWEAEVEDQSLCRVIKKRDPHSNMYRHDDLFAARIFSTQSQNRMDSPKNIASHPVELVREEVACGYIKTRLAKKKAKLR